jgi:hypothetical protein
VLHLNRQARKDASMCRPWQPGIDEAGSRTQSRSKRPGSDRNRGRLPTNSGPPRACGEHESLRIRRASWQPGCAPSTPTPSEDAKNRQQPSSAASRTPTPRSNGQSVTSNSSTTRTRLRSRRPATLLRTPGTQAAPRDQARRTGAGRPGRAQPRPDRRTARCRDRFPA